MYGAGVGRYSAMRLEHTCGKVHGIPPVFVIIGTHTSLDCGSRQHGIPSETIFIYIIIIIDSNGRLAIIVKKGNTLQLEME